MTRLGSGLAAALTAGILAAAPASAATTAVVYPVAGEGVSPDELEDVRYLLQAALIRTERQGTLASASPPLAAAACGPATTAAARCLATLAGKGVVIAARVRRSGSMLAVTLTAVNARGESFGPVGARLDPVVQNAQVLVLALTRLDELASDASRKPLPDALSAGLPAPGAVPVTPASRPDPAPRAWMRPAGRWITAAGIVLLGGSAVVSGLNKRRSDDLEERYALASLTEDDLSSYRTVDGYNTATAALLVAGSAAVVGGVTLWVLAPDAAPQRGRMGFGVSGRF
jgi:hypothetical protein